jgi:hypothetical protein
MSSAAVLKGRPIVLLPQISIWEYIEAKVKNYSSKIAQVSYITRYALHRLINYIQKAARKNKTTQLVFNHANISNMTQQVLSTIKYSRYLLLH